MSDPKKYLRKMIDSTVAGDSEGAENAFKQYIVPRSADFLNTNRESDATTPDSSESEVKPK